jgi:molecular chaperone DnaK (HSP70)
LHSRQSQWLYFLTKNRENPLCQKLISALPDRKKNKFQGELKAQVERAKLQLSSSNSAPIAIYGDLETKMET